MNDGLKQRIVGAVVLVVLAVIFLPMLLNFNADRQIDRTSRIPPRPVIEPVMVPESVRPQNVQSPKDADNIYQYDQSRAKVELAAAEQGESSEQASGNADKKPTPVPKPSLNDQGLPIGWVIQVGSFKKRDKAEGLEQSLLKDGYKVYSREANSQGYYRVYVGPNIAKKHALAAQKKIDAKYRVKSLLLKFEP